MPRGISASRNFYVLGVTPTQRKNLEILYAHLEKVEKINMYDFAAGFVEPMLLQEEAKEPENVCGTVCCLAGNGPLAGIKARKDEDWFEYASRVFGANGNAFEGPNARAWEWLFSGNWGAVDNTVAGGRARLRIALDKGIPLDYELQQQGRAPLSYKAA